MADFDLSDHTATGVPRHNSRLALGLERIGLLSLRFPIMTLVALALLAIAAAFGIERIKVDDSLSQLFRSDTAEFHQYERVVKQFPSSEFDVLIVVEGKKLLERSSVEKLRELVTDLQLVNGARGIVSMFSARQAPEGNAVPPPLFPDELPQGDAYKTLIGKALSNDIIRGKLLSEDGELTLIVLALDPAMVASNALHDTVGEIRKSLDSAIAGTGLSGQLSGVPVMQLEIRNAVERDRLTYNAIGFFAGCLIAILFFRRISFMIVAAGPPLIAILLSLGALGWLGFQLNMFLNVMTPLIMVISFSDSMQLTFAARDRLIAGEPKILAFRRAVLVVGPACVLTHATAALSFVALQFSQSELIRTFGEAGLLATIVALLTVLLLVPLFGILLVRHENTFVAKIRGADFAVDLLRRFCSWIAVRMVKRPGLYSLLAVLVVGGLGVIYANLEPRYRLADQVPDKQQAVTASSRIDAKLTGANPIDTLIEFPKGTSIYSPEALAVIGAVQTAMEKQAGVGNVWSLETLRRWISEKTGKTDATTLKSYIDVLPVQLVRRFISADQESVVVTGRIPDIDASKLLPVVDTLNAQLDDVRKQYPSYKISVTGLAVIAARNSASMIDKLNLGLTAEFLLVAIFIGVAFRSVVIFLSAILPGIFPVVLSGTILWLTGQGLQFASVVALTVSFGLGLSATIHFLNRMRNEEAAGVDPALVVERATILVGPALILTSVVLACGLAVTVFSDLPSLRLFGWLSAFAMMAALIADLFILRPTIMYLTQIARRFRN